MSREHYASCEVPLLDEHLVYLDEARSRVIPPEVTAASLVDELAWWAEQPTKLRLPATQHIDVLGHLHLELTGSRDPAGAAGDAPGGAGGPMRRWLRRMRRPAE